MELYKMADKKKGRADRDKDEIQYEKDMQECTFQPNPHKRRGRRASPSPQKVSRKEPLEKQKFQQQRDRSQPAPLRGGQNSKQVNVITKSHEIQESNFEDEDDHDKGEEALLFVDVNFGEDKTRIALYEKSQPEVVARKFAKLHGLDSNLAQNLVDLLREQMNAALQNEEEDEENE